MEASSSEHVGENALLAPGEPAIEAPPPDLADEQLRRQAEQLAEYLRARQRELDHRESQLNAQSAQLESDARTARIWLGEREVEIQERERERIALEIEWRQRLDRLAAADAALTRRAEALGRNGNLPDNRDTPLGGLPRETEIQQALSGISATWGVQAEQLASQAVRQANLADNIPSPENVKLAEDSLSQEKKLGQRALELARKHRDLEETERRTAEAQAEIRRIREQLLEEREAHREEVRSGRQRMAGEQRRAIAELEQKRELLERRADRVDRCRTALEQLRAELQRLHRETLEIRLATEELWAQLSGAAPPAALTRSLGRIRTQLADQYRATNAELLERKQELASIRDQLAAQYEKLIEQRRQFEHWATGRQQEAEQQAARLIAREQTLADTESRFAERSRQWEIERREYEQEIRRLRLQLPPREGSAKVA
jgi:hypothetical protein